MCLVFYLAQLAPTGLLTRVYTQNIDTIEKLTGLTDEDVVYAHGSFADIHCIKCRKQMLLDDWKKDVLAESVPKCAECNGLVKPDIVFFGEELPEKFHKMNRQDFRNSDCLMVFGTSLKVGPFNDLITNNLSQGDLNPRVLVNQEKVGMTDDMGDRGFRFEDEKNWRDLFLEGSCDDAVRELCKELGWEKDLDKLIATAKANPGDGWEMMVRGQCVEEEKPVDVIGEPEERSTSSVAGNGREPVVRLGSDSSTGGSPKEGGSSPTSLL